MKISLGRWEYWLGVFGLVLTLAVVAAVAFFWSTIRSLEAYGYIGAFVISVVGGATILAPVPMTPVIFALGSVLKPVYVGIAAGLGETVGGLAIYFTGYGGGTAFVKLKKSRIQELYSKMTRRVGKSAPLTIFVLSATINPLFYPAALAAGALRFRLWKYILICLIGKTIKGLTVAFAGFLGLRELLKLLGVPF